LDEEFDGLITYGWGWTGGVGGEMGAGVVAEFNFPIFSMVFLSLFIN
jgi:hypothetical protein